MIALLYIPVAVLFAWLNWYWIVKKKKNPKHFWNGMLHATVACLVYWKTKDWKAAVAVVFIARLVFDTSLNLMRGLPVDYISPEIKQYTGIRMAWQKGKTIDYIEYKLFRGNGIVPKIVYLISILLLLTL